MSGPPRVKSMNFTEPEARPVLGPAGNKARSVELRKLIVKPKNEKTQRPSSADESKGKNSPAALQSLEMMSKITPPAGYPKNGSSVASILRQRQPNLSLNASCSSDASSDSSHSRASTGRVSRRSGTQTPPLRRKHKCSPKSEKIENEGNGKNVGAESEEGVVVKKRCAWVTSNTDPSYAAFHDEEWGLPIHDDKKLFELLSFSTALAELTWPVILSKRHIFRDVFLDFDPVAVSKLNEKKITTPGSPASSLLSELKLRAIIENARQICKIIDEVGSFDKYIWGFVNYKPIVGNFRYLRQVPIKTSKADAISKDLVRRGFRGVGQTVVYSFMQVAGITNDHLISCFRHHDCLIAGDLRNKNEGISSKNKGKPLEGIIELELIREIDDMSLSSLQLSKSRALNKNEALTSEREFQC
ncbi:probable gmp synthase [glutamine-hydrolyzing] [Phtheirospermum japonicum]|uniref:Probable gmp synthase [glutamine-hydrolyzing] n=1 Tax=Phtheirospermum japonicum TaxID=374723 RepID=A0A830DJ54_9LAMI|nr:probable gmp synthase [glutamine-hydrolyzing] [Phtheirospermum japonicum]